MAARCCRRFDIDIALITVADSREFLFCIPTEILIRVLRLCELISLYCVRFSKKSQHLYTVCDSNFRRLPEVSI